MDVALIAELVDRVRVPVIAEGGAGNLDHLSDALEAGAAGVAVGTILVFSDIAYTGGPILSSVSPTSALSGVGAILLMAIAVAAIVGESEETRIRRLEPDAIVLLLAYVATLVVIALHG